MWTAIKAFFTSNAPQLIEWLGIIAGAAGAIFAVRRSGVEAQQNADMKQELKGAEVRNEVEQSTTAAGDAANLGELQQWDRKL